MEWISVKDKIPEEARNMGGTGFSNEVLVVDKEGDMYLTSYVYPWRNIELTGFNESGQHGLIKEDVTHWMPLPEKPKAI